MPIKIRGITPKGGISMKKMTLALALALVVCLAISACTADPPPSPMINLYAPVATYGYRMARIAGQEAVSDRADGLDADIAARWDHDFTGETFYSESFVIDWETIPGRTFDSISIVDKNTGADLTATERTALHVYTGGVPTEAYVEEHPTLDVPASVVLTENATITCVFVSLDKYTLDELDVILAYTDDDGHQEEIVSVNSDLADIDVAPAYPVNHSLIQLGSHYYVADEKAGIGVIPWQGYYTIHTFRCVSLPLTGAVPELEGLNVALFDKETGDVCDVPEGAGLYYAYSDDGPRLRIDIGAVGDESLCEQLEAFVSETRPGFVLPNGNLIFS